MIELKNISYGYSKSNYLFNNLTLKLQPGNIYGLLGKNGAGKTTLLKLMAGVLFAESGSVSVLNSNPELRKPSFLTQLFYLPEKISLPEISTRKLVGIYEDLYENFDSKKLNLLLNQFEIPENANANSLSSGQLKRFMLCLAFAANTKILLMDEPTNGLDIPAKTIFRKALAESFEEDKIIIVSTHLVEDVSKFINPVIIINEGEILLNHNLEYLSSKLSIKKVLQKPNENHTLFSEKIAGGYIAVQIKEEVAEEDINLEYLFNAVINPARKISEYLKELEDEK